MTSRLLYVVLASTLISCQGAEKSASGVAGNNSSAAVAASSSEQSTSQSFEARVREVQGRPPIYPAHPSMIGEWRIGDGVDGPFGIYGLRVFEMGECELLSRVQMVTVRDVANSADCEAREEGVIVTHGTTLVFRKAGENELLLERHGQQFPFYRSQESPYSDH